jgi:hypothetical protein
VTQLRYESRTEMSRPDWIEMNSFAAPQRTRLIALSLPMVSDDDRRLIPVDLIRAPADSDF